MKEEEKNQLNLPKIASIKNVKSLLIFRKIFSFLNKEIKLRIIIYNKSVNKKLNIDIKDYINFSGRKFYYINGKKIEMSIEKKIKVFEGEYLNKKRNGKGKEYHDNGIIKFEGEYLNGKKNGKGKEYYDNGKLKFEGEYLKGKRNGKGKEYNDNGSLKFEGEYLNDRKWKGEGEEYDYFGNLLFKGKYLDGKQNNGIKFIIIIHPKI